MLKVYFCFIFKRYIQKLALKVSFDFLSVFLIFTREDMKRIKFILTLLIGLNLLGTNIFCEPSDVKNGDSKAIDAKIEDAKKENTKIENAKNLDVAELSSGKKESGDIVSQASCEKNKDNAQDNLQDSVQVNAQDSVKDNTRDSNQDNTQDSVPVSAQDSLKDNVENNVKDNAQDSVENNMQDNEDPEIENQETPFDASVKNLVKVFPSKSNIENKKNLIEKDQKIGKRVDAIFACAAVAAIAYTAYKCGKYFFSKKKVTKTKSLSNSDLTKRLLKLEKKFDGSVNPKFLSLNWFKHSAGSISSGIITSGLMSVFSGAAINFYKKYHSFSDLKTFIQNKLASTNIENRVELVFPQDATLSDSDTSNRAYINYVLSEVKNKMLFNSIIFDSLESFAILYDRMKGDRNIAVKIVAREFNISLRNVVDFSESVIAFMDYKMDSIEDVALTEDDAALPGYLFELTNEYCQKVNKVLNGESEESLFDLTFEFKEVFVTLMDAFNGIESRVEWLSRGA